MRMKDVNESASKWLKENHPNVSSFLLVFHLPSDRVYAECHIYDSWESVEIEIPKQISTKFKKLFLKKLKSNGLTNSKDSLESELQD